MSVSDEKKPAASTAKTEKAEIEAETEELSGAQLDDVAGGALMEPTISRREVRYDGGPRKFGGIRPSLTPRFSKPTVDKSDLQK